MLTLFWDERGVILEHYMARGNTVNSATYAYLLKNYLRPAIKSKRGRLLSTGVLLQRDCSAPYCPFNCCNNPISVLWLSSTSAVLARPRPQWLSCLWTAQRGDGTPSLSGPTKRCSRRCMSGCALSQKTFFSRGIHALPKHWNTCMVRIGDYGEKWSHCVPFVFNKLRDKNI